MILIKLICNLFLVMQLSMLMTTTVIMMVRQPTFAAAADVTAAVTDASKIEVVGGLRKVRMTNDTMHDENDPPSNTSIPPQDRCQSCNTTVLGIQSGLQIYFTGFTIGGNCLKRCVYPSTLWAWKLTGWACGECYIF